MDSLRLLLIGSLCFVLLLIWQAWERDYGRQATPVLPSATSGGASVGADTPTPPAADTTAPSAAVESGAASTAPPMVTVRTDALQAVISAQGGDLVQVSLRDYPVAIDQPDQPFVLLDNSPALTFIAQGGLLSKQAAPTHREIYSADQAVYELTAEAQELSVPLRWRSPEGVEVTKTYRFRRGSHLVEVSYTVENGGAAPWNARMYAQLQRKLEEEKRGVVPTYTGAAVSSAEKRYEKLPFDDMTDQPLDRDIADGWAAMLQHYFVAALIPESNGTYRYYTKVVDNNRYIIGLYSPEVAVAPGAAATFGHKVYLGPKIQDTLERIAPGLELTVDYGSLWFIAKPLFWLLQKIHALTANWGWSIVLLTLLVKALFYHLSATSYRSMAKMRRVQPRLLALRERYAEDRGRMNQAMMDLYREEKINPLGGCLPIVIQIPVFLALYWVLLESVELRQAPFIVWIKDLSTQDPYYVLPIAMGITMLLQQRMNPAPLDPVQQKVMQIMPIVFTVFFAFFPSGLVLYWLVNNLLSIGQQWLITRSIEGERAKVKA